jgi:chromosome segregation ATPase
MAVTKGGIEGRMANDSRLSAAEHKVRDGERELNQLSPRVAELQNQVEMLERSYRAGREVGAALARAKEDLEVVSASLETIRERLKLATSERDEILQAPVSEKR